jgi:pseudouridylate synthase / pseudouridine kinase
MVETVLRFSQGLTGRKLNGGTTVAATMVLAHLAGIRVFATGGLGGVHRGAESTMDISADLTELGRTPIGVISSGCKGFLDIPRTLEYLETQGVGVATFADGRNGEVDYPAFWSRDSGFRSPMTISDEKEAAAMICTFVATAFRPSHVTKPLLTVRLADAQSTIPITSALHFANPAPESFSIAKSDMEGMINEAIKSAIEIGAGGKDNTPFILARIKELSGGKSVEVNRALIEANVARGAMVARELAKLEGNNSRTITE